ncbi:hypothetical protein [Sphingomonas arenae]|uniref:hypothetical protein n=1 Tax=Sphingomonas arenae TaxID=2812555 RepID=UPI00196842C5|nr:hypothetical protein [Sphingomonas arenae]
MRRSVTALQLGTCLGTAGLLVLGATPALAASATPAATADRPMPAPARINLPLVFSGTFLGDIGAQIAPDGSGLALDPADFVRLAGDRLTPTMKARIQGARGSSGLVTAEEFKAAGVEVAYDPATLEVSVSIPLDQQGRRSLALVQEASVFDSDYDPPTGFSGTGIFNVSQNVSHEQGWFGDFQPVNVAAQTAFNLGGAKGLNLFAEMFYGGGEGGLRRGAVTLTRDDRDRALRLMAGDISPTAAGFQSSLPIGGIGIEKNYSQLQPYRNVRPSGLFKFALDEPAVVEVLVNGVVARAFRLERGQYDVRDFNFASGLNRIDIYVVDDYGRRLLTSFSQFFNFNLLDPGISEFGAYAGFPQLRSGGGSIAYGGDPTLTLFYRRGLTQSLTAGFDFQAGGGQAVGGVSAGLATGIGTFGVAGAVSRDALAGAGHQLLLNYELGGKPAAFLDSPALNVEVRHRSRNFVALGDAAGDDPTRFDLRARFSATVFDRFGVGLSGLMTTKYGNRPSDRSLGLNLSTSLMSMTFNASAERTRTERGAGTRFLLSASRSLGFRTSGRSSFDSRSRSTQLEYSRYRGDELGDYGYRALISRDRSGFAGSGELSYNANRAFIALRHDLTTDLAGKNMRQRSSYSLATQVAFAGDRVGFGRPVGTNFLLAYPHRTLRSSVLVTRGIEDEKIIARSGIFGPALAPAGGAHAPRRVTVRAETLPDGYDPGKSYYELLPGPATGYLAQVGSDASRTVQGNLIDGSGAPIGLAVGDLVRIDKAGGKKVQIFTNRAGRFVATGLAPGKYRLEIGADKLIAELVVGEDQDGIIEVGRVSARQEER